MEQELKRYVRGGPYWDGHPPYQEGIEFNYIGNNWTLTFSLPDLTPNEVKDINSAPCYFGAYVEKHILFFLFRFGRTWGWSDAPYNWWLVPEDYRTIPEYRPPERALLTIIVVDSRVNRILTMRAVTIPPGITEYMVTAIREQTENFISGRAEYNEILAAIRNRLTPAAMARSGVFGRGGQ